MTFEGLLEGLCLDTSQDSYWSYTEQLCRSAWRHLVEWFRSKERTNDEDEGEQRQECGVASGKIWGFIVSVEDTTS